MKTKEQKAIVTLKSQLKFFKDGYTNAGLPWYSPKDLSNFIGKTRQYWCKLIKEGKLEAHQTSAGPIVTTEQLVKFYSL